jgi:hypothetical protein
VSFRYARGIRIGRLQNGLDIPVISVVAIVITTLVSDDVFLNIKGSEIADRGGWRALS